MAFQMDMTLQKTALVATAECFWKKDDIRTMLKHYLYPHCRRGTEKSLAELIQKALRKMDPDSIPRVLSNEVLLAIKDMGYKIINWFFYIRRKRAFRNISREELCDTYYNNIYFTHYGAIDELKILRYSWLEIHGVDLGRLYIMACYSCSEGLISELWERMVAANYQFYSYQDLYKTLGSHLVAYWNKLRENALVSFHDDCIVPWSQMELIDIYDENESVEVNMFRLSASKGYVRAVKFFGGKISAEARDRNIVYCFTSNIERYHIKHDWEFHKKEQCIEICLYLSKFLTERTIKFIFEDTKIHRIPPYIENRDDFLYFDVLSKMFISMWPWQSYFGYFFNLVVDTIGKDQFSSLMSNLIQTTCDNFRLGERFKNSVFQKLLHQVWRATPSDWKVSIGVNLDIKTLFRCDMTTSQLILNDSQMAAERDGLIKKFYESYFDIVQDGNDKILRDFIDKILVSPEWSENVRGMIRSIYSYVMDEDIDSINKSLQSLPQEVVKNLKLKIDPELMCYYLITKNKFESADEFLNWKFDSNASILSFKKSFRDKKFTMDYIRNSWKVIKDNVEEVKTILDKFLVWFLGMEIDTYKAQHLVSTEFDLWKFIKRNDFGILKEFLSWCNVDKNAQLVNKDELKNFLRDCMARNSINEAENALNFVFDTEEERHGFMRETLTVKSASISVKNKYYILACKLYIGKYFHFDLFSPKPSLEEMTENFTKFINYFIRPYVKNFEELKSALEEWPEKSRRYTEEVEEDDASSQDAYSDDPEGSDEIFEHLMYCERESYKLFLSLLDSIENETV